MRATHLSMQGRSVHDRDILRPIILPCMMVTAMESVAAAVAAH